MIGIVSFMEISVGTINEIIVEWETDGAGVAEATTLNHYSGEVIKCIVDPLSTIPPASPFNITIEDCRGIDLLCDKGLALLNNKKTYLNDLGVVAAGCLSFKITAAGANRKGQAILYIR